MPVELGERWGLFSPKPDTKGIMRGKPFFVTKERFPPCPFPRKSQRNKYGISIKQSPADAYGKRCRDPRAGRHLPPSGCKASGKTKRTATERTCSLPCRFLFSVGPWIILIVFLSFSFPQASCGNNCDFPSQPLRKPESRGGTPLARGYGGRGGPCLVLPP